MQLWNHCVTRKSNLHIMGLLSDGGVHSHIRHLIEFIKTSQSKEIPSIILHVFSDGRDVNRDKFGEYFKELNHATDGMANVIRGTVTGRYYAMDRDNNWDRMDKFINMLNDETYSISAGGITPHIEYHYSKGILDEHLEQIKLSGNIHLHPYDGVFISNFRADRVRMLTEKLLQKKYEMNICIVTLTEYKADYDVLVAYKPITIETTLARELSLAGISQSHFTETEKFPNATYFLNGGVETPYEGEEHILIPTRKDVMTHDEVPEMRAIDIAYKACEEIDKGK